MWVNYLGTPVATDTLLATSHLNDKVDNWDSNCFKQVGVRPEEFRLNTEATSGLGRLSNVVLKEKLFVPKELRDCAALVQLV